MLFDLSTIDLELLKDQKQALINVIYSLHEDDEDKEKLDGVLSLLDCIQDKMEGNNNV